MKFSSKPTPEHQETPLADEGRWEEIVDQWTERSETRVAAADKLTPCYVLSVGEDRDARIREAQLAEIVNLVRAQGGEVLGKDIYYLSKRNPRTLIGKGTAREQAARARACGATMLVLDAELSPSQLRNLEDTAGIPICDREAIILNVFLRHARTSKARIQVEIAPLEYLRPRIRGVGLDMDQQTGGIKGARGPGETASELLARKLDGRLAELKKAEKKIALSAGIQRQQRSSCKMVVLLGYTNAGKTSLMNAVAAESLSARDRPFETLDTTSRNLSRYGEDILLSDTVGFIRRLPERLLESFESTLAEIAEATLLVIVVDLSDYEKEEHLETTHAILKDLKSETIPRLYVFNKADRIPELPGHGELLRLSCGHPWQLTSALEPASGAELRERILRLARNDEAPHTLFLPYSASQTLSLLYGRTRVIDSKAEASGIELSYHASSDIQQQILASLEVERDEQ